MDKYFEDLMEKSNAALIEENGNVYAIRVMGRGENLFFRENDKALICQIDAEHGIIYKKSIKIWDSADEKMTKVERERVSELIYTLYKKVYNPEAVFR